MRDESVPVKQLMTTELLTVSLDLGILEAADIMLDEEVGSLIVVDSEGQLAGVLTSTDFVKLTSESDVAGDTTVSDHMSENVITVSAADSIQEAAVKMIRQDIQHLPVLDSDSDMIGMLSTTDLTGYLTYTGSQGTE